MFFYLENAKPAQRAFHHEVRFGSFGKANIENRIRFHQGNEHF
jgi:hypothetical protein